MLPATLPGPDDGAAGRHRLAATIWVVAGLLSYWLAAAAVAPGLIGLARHLVAPGPTLASALHPVVVVASFASPAVVPLAGYLALRCWIVPVEPRSWRGTVTLPCFIVVCMLPVILVGMLFGVVLAYVLLIAAGGSLPTLAISGPRSGAFALGFCVAGGYTGAGALVGLGLWAVEREATQRLLGRRAPPGLLRAHVAGAAIIGLVTATPFILGLSGLFPVVGIAGLRRIDFAAARLAAIPHLLMTWRAWNRDDADGWRVGPDLLRGAAVALLAFFLIGTALRLPASPSPLQALLWPRDYALGLAAVVGHSPPLP